MARKNQDILIVEYNGSQGSVELASVEDATINRSRPRSKVKTMNRARVPIGYQSGTEEVNVSLTVIPELTDPEVDWHRAWKDDEVFQLTIEKGLDGIREQLVDCMVADINNTSNEAGEAREEIQIEALLSRNEPQ